MMSEDYDYESLPTNSVAVHMTAGAVAGIMEHCIMYPFDSVKVSSATACAAHTLSTLRSFYITSSPAARSRSECGRDATGIPAALRPRAPGKMPPSGDVAVAAFSSALSWKRPPGELTLYLVPIYSP